MKTETSFSISPDRSFMENTRVEFIGDRGERISFGNTFDFYFTVTLFARLRGLSGSLIPRARAR